MSKKQYSFRLDEIVMEQLAEMATQRMTVTDLVEMAIKWIIKQEDEDHELYKKIIAEYFSGDLDYEQIDPPKKNKK